MHVQEGHHKRFDAKDHELNDKPGRDALIKILNKKMPHLTHMDNPNRYGIDVLSINDKNEVVYAWDAEVRRGNWKGDIPFPFDTINCIERKESLWYQDEKFLKNIPKEFIVTNNCVTFYVQFNDLCNRAAILKGIDILKYPKKTWANRKASGEMVRQVPVSEATQVRLG